MEIRAPPPSAITSEPLRPFSSAAWRLSSPPRLLSTSQPSPPAAVGSKLGKPSWNADGGLTGQSVVSSTQRLHSGGRNNFRLRATPGDKLGLMRKLLDTEPKLDECNIDQFKVLKQRFLKFKRENYGDNLSHYQNLAEQQKPEFMVIACGDSRVCPTSILGFQPGEAFTVRNIANLVPPYEHGASETSAALEFAVNSLEVNNILIIGHSRCGGIQALMSMKAKPASRSFIRDWVSIASIARLSTEAAASASCSFEKRCQYCEKESINSSLLNLLTYPWIQERVTDQKLALHGGYYNFIDCTFEKWTLAYKEGAEGGSKYAIKDRALWS